MWMADTVSRGSGGRRERAGKINFGKNSKINMSLN